MEVVKLRLGLLVVPRELEPALLPPLAPAEVELITEDTIEGPGA